MPHIRYAPFDWLATLVAVVDAQGRIVFANAALEDALGHSRRSLVGVSLATLALEPHAFAAALAQAAANAFATQRYDAWLKRHVGAEHDPLPVHVVVAQIEGETHIVVEMLPVEAQTRQEREDRLQDQNEANKELVRNLAHEIKNPLGGIRGAAQLLQMDLESPDLVEYTKVIIHEADRLQSLVDRLLAPHRKPHVVGDVNIHEVFERVRSLVLVEFPKGLKVRRDYDVSIPEFRGDREQLIQVFVNLVHNAALALSQRITDGDAEIVLKSRVARQATIAKQRYRLALELHVIDNGPGVPESIKDRIFYPLVSFRDGGSGLGLTLAQTFVQQHHGVIECESVPGRTDFTVLIPLP
jgi:two-component system, NtrC family, nitrogen regulation sensor histidine kinase GlnL